MLTRRAFIGGAAKALAALGLARALPAAGATEPDWLEIEGERLASDPVADNVLWEGLDSLVPEGDSPVLTEEALARAWRPTGEPATVVADETRAAPLLQDGDGPYPLLDLGEVISVEVRVPNELQMERAWPGVFNVYDPPGEIGVVWWPRSEADKQRVAALLELESRRPVRLCGVLPFEQKRFECVATLHAVEWSGPWSDSRTTTWLQATIAPEDLRQVAITTWRREA